MAMLWSEEESAEIENCPIRLGWTDFTEAQLKLRKGMAQKVWLKLVELDTEMPAWAIRDYEKCPPWKFYTNKDGNACYRVYGAMNGRMHVASAHLFINVIAISDLVPVENWTTANLRTTLTPGLFLDPLGFMRFIADQRR